MSNENSDIKINEQSETATSEFVDGLIDQQPLVSDHVIELETQKIKTSQESLPAGFDPEIHDIDKNGAPRLTPTGRFKKKRSTRKRPETPRGQSSVALPSNQSTDNVVSDAAMKQQCVLCGHYAANSLITIGYLIGGDEFEPALDKDTGLDERVFLETAFGDYFVAKNITDFPPGITLALAITAYITPRLPKPKTQSKLKKIKTWFTRIYLRLRYGSQFDSRNDRERKNDASKKDE
jgi:hypothetical protein